MKIDYHHKRLQVLTETTEILAEKISGQEKGFVQGYKDCSSCKDKCCRDTDKHC